MDKYLVEYVRYLEALFGFLFKQERTYINVLLRCHF